MNKSKLKEKALKVAIWDLKYCRDRETANEVYVKWKCFHNEPTFMDAVERKKIELKKNES